MMKGYVLVKYRYGEVEPAVVTSPRYVRPGTEVILRMHDGHEETAVTVTELEGFVHPDEAIAEISKLFDLQPDELVRVIGTVDRYYWEEEEDGEKK